MCPAAQLVTRAPLTAFTPTAPLTCTRSGTATAIGNPFPHTQAAAALYAAAAKRDETVAATRFMDWNRESK